MSKFCILFIILAGCSDDADQKIYWAAKHNLEGKICYNVLNDEISGRYCTSYEGAVK